MTVLNIACLCIELLATTERKCLIAAARSFSATSHKSSNSLKLVVAHYIVKYNGTIVCSSSIVQYIVVVYNVILRLTLRYTGAAYISRVRHYHIPDQYIQYQKPASRKLCLRKFKKSFILNFSNLSSSRSKAQILSSVLQKVWILFDYDNKIVSIQIP